VPRVLAVHSCGVIDSAAPLVFQFVHGGPEEADELTGCGDGGDLRVFSGGNSVEELVQTVLSLPRVSDHVRRLTTPTFLEIDADGGPVSVLPGGLHQNVATPAVAGLGDGPLVLAIAGRVLARDEAKLGHELSRALKASPVANLGSQGHRGERVDATEAAQAVDDGLVGSAERELLDLLVEVISATDLVVEQREILTEHPAVVGFEMTLVWEALEPVPVLAGPWRCFTRNFVT
jgi:hypothetical protein